MSAGPLESSGRGRNGSPPQLRDMTMHRIMSGPLRDGMAMDARELEAALVMSERQVKASLAGLVDKGFVVNLTPERLLDKAVLRLTGTLMVVYNEMLSAR
jgi:hypothetical protein